MRMLIYIYLLLIVPILIAAPGTVQVEGEPIRLLGDETSARMNPEWSPDGKMLACTSPNYIGLWIMEADGNNVQQISDELSAGYGFEWAPNSKALLYRVDRYDGYRRFTAYKMFDFSINASRQICDFRLRLTDSAHWNNGSEEVILFGKNGRDKFDTGLTSSDQNKSSLREKICYMQGLQIYLYNTSNSSAIPINPLPGSRYLDATLSPNGRYIAFQVVAGHMYIIDIESKDLVDLGRGYRPRWSPDSRQLIYMICEDNGYQFTDSDLYVIERTGDNKQQVTNTAEALEMNPVWSPDGKKIAYDRMDQGAIYVLELVD